MSHATNLPIKSGQIEPVRCLGGDDQICNLIVESTCLRWSASITDSRVRHSLFDLFRTGVRCVYLGKLFGQQRRQLSGTTPAIPRKFLSGNSISEKSRQLDRIGWTISSVASCRL